MNATPLPRFSTHLRTLLLITLVTSCSTTHEKRKPIFGTGATLPGTWYVALDAGPFIPEVTNHQLFLSGLATLNRDGTALLYDGGDLGAAGFGTRHTPQQGVWIAKGENKVEITTLFIEANASDGEVNRWLKVHMTLELDDDSDHLAGYANLYALPCGLEPPIPVPSPIKCSDPIANASSFAPDGPSNIPIRLTKLRTK